MRVGRLIATVKPLRPKQLLGRAQAAGKTCLRKALPAPARKLLGSRRPAHLIPEPILEENKPAWLSRRDRTAASIEAQNIIEGTFDFHNQKQIYPKSIRWRNPVGNYLWDYELHSFRYLDSFRCLAEDGDALDHVVMHAKTLMRDWVANCRYPHMPGWHSEVLSRRLANWTRFLIDFPEDTDIDLHDSLAEQATCLEHNIETFLPGVQLLENGIALAMTGLYFHKGDAPRRWLDEGMQILSRQLSVQVLPGGGHFERSPMYACHLLEGLINCYNLLKARKMQPVWLTMTMKAMAQRISKLLHPDGDIPLLNDSALGQTSHPIDILEYARNSFDFRLCPPEEKVEEDGYFVFSDAKMFLVIDNGPLGPDFLPSHGHADNLSYEMSIGKKRVIVDSGVFSYASDDLRTYCRGTSGHNTVVVDFCDQSDVWSAFRVGRRAKPLPPVVFESDELSAFTGGHDGYRSLPGAVIHRRSLLHVPRRFYVISDCVSGSRPHRLESHIHLAPGLKADWQDDRVLVTDQGKTILQVLPFGTDVMQKSFGWYCPRFGVKESNLHIVFAVASELPYRFGYFLVPDDADLKATATFDGESSLYSVQIEGQPPIVIRGLDTRFSMAGSRQG